MINIFKEIKENKKLKKEIEELQVRYDRMCREEDKELFNLSYYNSKIDELNKKIRQLQEELTKLYEKNYELAKKITDDTTDKIEEFINELEHNIQVDKIADDKLTSAVSCDYVIERLKDIIK